MTEAQFRKMAVEQRAASASAPTAPTAPPSRTQSKPKPMQPEMAQKSKGKKKLSKIEIGETNLTRDSLYSKTN